MNDVVILDAARTAIGTFGGSLAQTPPSVLATTVTKEAMARAGVDPALIGHVSLGHVINTEPRDMYLSRVAAIEAGIPDTTPAMNVNRLCGSGLQAIVSTAQSIMLGDADFGIAGGAENMSRSPYIMPASRWGQKMGDVKTLDMMLGALNCPFGTGHMGVTAENVAREHDISREDQDNFALTSQNRARAAIDAGYFASQIVPVEVKVKRDMVPFELDEHPKTTTLEQLAGLRAVFEKDGTVTAGNASGINDGAAALVLASGDAAEKAGLKPRARSHALKCHSNALTAANAHGAQRLAPADPFQLIKRFGRDDRTCGAHRMAQSNRAAIGIHFVRIQTKRFVHCAGLGGKGLV